MKNNECVIYITTKHGYTQTYCKDEKGWIQKSPKGIIRRMTAEQLLSHILPPLTSENKGKLIVRVEKKKDRSLKSKKE